MTATVATDHHQSGLWWARPEEGATLGPRDECSSAEEEHADEGADQTAEAPNAGWHGQCQELTWEVLKPMVDKIIAQRDHPGEVLAFLKTPEGQTLMREQMVHQMDRYLVRSVVSEYFKTTEGREYIEGIVNGDGSVAQLAKVAATEKTETWLERNLTERVEQILKTKGVVRQKAKWVWGFFGMMASIALVMCFNWLFYSAPQDVSVLGMRLVSSEAVAYCRTQVAPIVALTTILAVLYGVCMGLFPSSSGRHCRRKRAREAARRPKADVASGTASDQPVSHDKSETANDLRRLTNRPNGPGRRRRRTRT